MKEYEEEERKKRLGPGGLTLSRSTSPFLR